MTPIKELLEVVDSLGDDAGVSRRLGCSVAYIAMWRPRPRPNGTIEPGWTPSAGFIAAALAILRGSPLSGPSSVLRPLSSAH